MGRLVKASRLGVALLTMALAGGGALAGSSAAFASGRPLGPLVAGIPQAPSIGAPSTLNSVFCTSSADCWSVGSFARDRATLNQALHWTGHQWFRVRTPQPGGINPDDLSQLDAVRCTSASNCWAVGDYRKVGTLLDQILHWNGKKWTRVDAPSPGGTSDGDFNELFDVACTSATSCWATGTYGIQMSTTSQVAFNQILFWNGMKWALIKTPNPGGMSAGDLNAIGSVRCSSSGNCWAAGEDGTIAPKIVLRNQMLHWNGSKWKLATVPNPGGTKPGDLNVIDQLSCTSAKDCWAVGFFGAFSAKGFSRNEILRWTGKHWVNVVAPEPDRTKIGFENFLDGINCTSATDCWAVGASAGTSILPGVNEALHWNGSKWSVVTTPNPSGAGKGHSNELFSVRCTSTANCWAVGQQQKTMDGPTRDQILRWNGAKWATS